MNDGGWHHEASILYQLTIPILIERVLLNVDGFFSWLNLTGLRWCFTRLGFEPLEHNVMHACMLDRQSYRHKDIDRLTCGIGRSTWDWPMWHVTPTSHTHTLKHRTLKKQTSQNLLTGIYFLVVFYLVRLVGTCSSDTGTTGLVNPTQVTEYLLLFSCV